MWMFGPGAVNDAFSVCCLFSLCQTANVANHGAFLPTHTHKSTCRIGSVKWDAETYIADPTAPDFVFRQTHPLAPPRIPSTNGQAAVRSLTCMRGVGDTKAASALARFGSLQGVAAASKEVAYFSTGDNALGAGATPSNSCSPNPCHIVLVHLLINAHTISVFPRVQELQSTVGDSVARSMSDFLGRSLASK